MIPLSLGEIAAVVGGTVAGDAAVTVTAPAVLDGRQAEPGGLFIAFAGEHATATATPARRAGPARWPCSAPGPRRCPPSSSRTLRPRCRHSPPTSWPGCATG
ncbi:MAG TPA: hypothetical protein VIL16_33270 [Trebonia sp.]